MSGNQISNLDTVTGAQGFWSYPACAVERAQGAGSSSAASRRPAEDRTDAGFYETAPKVINISTINCAGRKGNNRLIND